MKASEFILLSEQQKKRTVLHDGVLIAKRTSAAYMIFLFQMDHYYVETWCNPQSKAIVQYRVFVHTDILQPYLDAISIDHLLE